MPKIAALFELRDNVVSGCVASLLRQFLLQAVLVQKAGYPPPFSACCTRRSFGTLAFIRPSWDDLCDDMWQKGHSAGR
jgi:hypothetical protein